VKRKLLLVGRNRYALPLTPSLEQKFSALESELEIRVLGSRSGPEGEDPRFRLFPPTGPGALEGPLFYALLPLRVARELRRSRPDAVLAQGAQETALVLLGRTLARSPARVIADIHGDPGSATGSTAPGSGSTTLPSATSSHAAGSAAPTECGRSRPTPRA